MQIVKKHEFVKWKYILSEITLAWATQYNILDWSELEWLGIKHYQPSNDNGMRESSKLQISEQQLETCKK